MFHSLHRAIQCNRCYESLEWKHEVTWFAGIKIESFFEYGKTFQTRIYQYKHGLDIELGQTFLHEHRWYLKLKYHRYTLVPAPSHEEDIGIRGFQHVRVIYQPLQLPFKELYLKQQPYHQAEQHAEGRLAIHHIIKRNNNDLPKQPICLVDDVMTTGETLKAMINLIPNESRKNLRILVLAKKSFQNPPYHSSIKMVK